MCNEDDNGGEATVRKDFFAWTENTEGNLLKRINPEATKNTDLKFKDIRFVNKK